jgi:tRNA pseudouridine13 synthase
MVDFAVELHLPYISRDLPGIGGELRVTPDHFVVEEIPLYTPQGEGQHLYVNLTKIGRTTTEVQAQLERLFELRRGEVGFAGLKDKAARATQTFSLHVGYQSVSYAEDAARRIRDALPVEVHWARFHRNKLRPGHLIGNRFTITVSHLACRLDEAIARVHAIGSYLAQSGLPNFFGPQRFGPGGGNIRQGLEILSGARTVQNRWLRRFLLDSVQSYLCNCYLAHRLEIGAFDQLLLGDIAKKYATGGMFEVENLAAEQLRYTAKEISFTAPLFGPKMWKATGDAGRLEVEVLAGAPVTLEQLAQARVEGTRRMGRLLVDGVQVTAQPGDHAITLHFALPKGAFATTVLREFMKVDLDQAPSLDDESGGVDDI